MSDNEGVEVESNGIPTAARLIMYSMGIWFASEQQMLWEKYEKVLFELHNYHGTEDKVDYAEFFLCCLTALRVKHREGKGKDV